LIDDVIRAIVSGLEALLARWFEINGTRPIAGPATALDLAAAGSLLAITLFLILIVHYSFRRANKSSAEQASSRVRSHILPALGRPLSALIAVFGICATMVPLLMHAAPSSGLSRARFVFDALLNVGSTLAFAWFLIRVSRSLEKVTLSRVQAIGSTSALLISLLWSAARLIIVLGALSAAVSLLELPDRYSALLGHLTSIALILTVAAFLIRAVTITKDNVLLRFPIGGNDLRARKVSTRIHFIGRAVYVAVGLFAFAAILMSFPQVRHIGVSLLTSAGILGIVVGVAAQKPLANLLAGLQIALTQPVREGDVVVMEGEWGRVEEITLSYVVVHIWDDRRLILPLSYLLEKPFQNWTRNSAAILGAVLVWTDYRFPVEAARKALKEIIEGHPLWDKRFWNLQVTDSSDRAMQIRVLATAADSSASWDLRCDIRERLLAFIQHNYPDCLPRLRAEAIVDPKEIER
jgi:small-conductance mechanosensitive channel